MYRFSELRSSAQCARTSLASSGEQQNIYNLLEALATRVYLGGEKRRYNLREYSWWWWGFKVIIWQPRRIINILTLEEICKNSIEFSNELKGTIIKEGLTRYINIRPFPRHSTPHAKDRNPNLESEPKAQSLLSHELSVVNNLWCKSYFYIRQIGRATLVWKCGFEKQQQNLGCSFELPPLAMHIGQ